MTFRLGDRVVFAGTRRGCVHALGEDGGVLVLFDQTYYADGHTFRYLLKNEKELELEEPLVALARSGAAA